MNTETRFAAHPNDVQNYTTEKLGEHYLLSSIFEFGEITSSYTMHDRMMTIGIAPGSSPISLPAFNDITKADYFLQRREMGVINVGDEGSVIVDGEKFELQHKECIYVGKGNKEIIFESKNNNTPAEFYINSCPAHAEYPTIKAKLTDANQVHLGSIANSNERTIYQYIHEDGIQSCQLVMGFTELKTGSVWNTFPPHTHHRRMEVYFYFDLPDDQLVMHFMGEPNETRHLVIRNKQAVISPEWSIHAGAGTSSYSFIWGMAGENKAFTDMDAPDFNTIR